MRGVIIAENVNKKKKRVHLKSFATLIFVLLRVKKKQNCGGVRCGTGGKMEERRYPFFFVPGERRGGGKSQRREISLPPYGFLSKKNNKFVLKKKKKWKAAFSIYRPCFYPVA